MSKPVFDDVFSFRGRRNRRSYALFTLGVWTLFLALTFLLVLVGASASDELGTVVAVGWLVALFPLAWASWTVSAQRCRDVGCTGWVAVLVLVPYFGLLVSLALFVIPGAVGANRYGPDPIAPDPVIPGRLQARAV